MPKLNLIILSLYLNSLFFVYGSKLLLFNYNIQNNLTIILIIMSEEIGAYGVVHLVTK